MTEKKSLLQLKLGLYASSAGSREEFCVWQKIILEAIIKGNESSIDNNRGCMECSGITYIPPFNTGCNAYCNLLTENARQEMQQERKKCIID